MDGATAVEAPEWELIKQGAEARVYKTEFFNKPAIVKERFVKSYRVSTLDQKLTQRRMAQEARSMARCVRHGIRAPAVYLIDFHKRLIFMENITDGVLLKEYIYQHNTTVDKDKLLSLVNLIGQVLAEMHNIDVIHGDLTTSNMLYHPATHQLTLIDFGLSFVSGLPEDKGVDLYVLERAFLSTHPNTEELFKALLESYSTLCKNSKVVIEKLDEVRLRGRKRTMMTLQGKVLTVLGPREPAQLGIVLPHEQPLVDLTKLLTEPQTDHQEYLKHLQLEMKTLGYVRYYPYSVLDNLKVDSEEEVLSELKLYKQAGGGTLCDVSPVGVRLKRESLPRISKETGLNIVAGTAFYVDPLMPEEVKLMSVDERCRFLVDEIEHGISGCGVRCGFIGEMGCSFPLTDNERKSLQAAALAQKKTGAPLMIHPGPTNEAPFEILDILESSGADISHTVIGHLDRTIRDDQTLLKLAQRGCYLEFDLFGTECSHYQLVPEIDFPSDAQKIRKIKLLVDNGYINRVLISTDIHTKHRMACYGGHGYAHIVEHIVPKMKDRGLSSDEVTQIIKTNPQTWLTFN